METNPSLAMMRLLHEAALLVNAKGEVEAISRGMEKCLGYDPNEWRLKKPTAMVSSEDETWADFVHYCLSSRDTRTSEISFQAKNGETISCQVEGTSLSPEIGDQSALIFVRVTPETISRTLIPTLNSRIKFLEDKLQQKDEFIAQLAHGLRNPLGPVLNGLRVLNMAKAEPETYARAHSLIERQIHYLTRIINEVLEVSRLTRGKIHLQCEPVDLAALIHDVAKAQRQLPEWKSLKLLMDVPEKPVWVQGDSPRLVQILKELLGNAAKFTPEGGRVLVRLSAHPQEKQVQILIRDTGIGIEKEYLRSLFDIFAPGQIKQVPKQGLGIGLMLVKGLVELHGGEIRAASAGTGMGSEFTIFLPLLESPAASPSTVAKPLPPATAMPRILIIEDNRDSADSMCMLLQFLGYDVRVAYTGPEGVRLAKEWNPLVVLSDIGLPGLDGWGVARELRQHPLTAQTRLIAITAYGLESDQNMSHDAGFEAHLVKPVDINDLKRLLSSPAKEKG